MATCITFQSAEAIEDYINSITLPVLWNVVGKRGVFTFISPEDVIAGANTFSMNLARSESELAELIASLTLSGEFVDVIGHGGEYYLLINDGGAASSITPSVNTYPDPYSLAEATGLVVTGGLDDSTGLAGVGDQLLTYGGLYTLVEAVPVDMLIVSKGAFFTVINSI